MQQFELDSMWQPDMLQVAKFLDAVVKRMQEMTLMLGRASYQPGWLEQCNHLGFSTMQRLRSIVVVCTGVPANHEALIDHNPNLRRTRPGAVLC